MRISITATEDNTKDILTLIEEMGYDLPCNCHGAHRCDGRVYAFDCSAIPTSSIEVDLPMTSSDIHSISIEDMSLTDGLADTLLIDLGTTTIALTLLSRQSGQIRLTSTYANPQIRYGSDVISRIQAAHSGYADALRQSVRTSLEREVSSLCQRNHQDISSLTHCYIGGNTTMIHILLGYDCTSLGHSPFEVIEDSPSPRTYKGCKVYFAPWISAYVGGDISAGLLACPIASSDDTALFVDLGTNGEIVLSHHGDLYATATAAGPAFEGSGLSCGCPAIPGAIYKVKLKPLRPALETIDNRMPTGICGSGAISLYAELLRLGYFTDEGILSDSFPSDGLVIGRSATGDPIRYTAEDLEHVRLAVAAIAAGIDTLADIAGISTSAIEHIYLAGGFGFSLPPEDCETVGLFSSIPSSSIQVMGNTCLLGLYQWAVGATHIVTPDSVTSVNLAESSVFQERYLYHLAHPGYHDTSA